MFGIFGGRDGEERGHVDKEEEGQEWQERPEGTCI